MLPYGEIKRDIKAGFNYRVYSAKWYGGEVTAILEGYNGTVIFDFTGWNASKGNEPDGTESYRYFVLTIEEFMSAKYKEITERANYCLFS